MKVVYSILAALVVFLALSLSPVISFAAGETTNKSASEAKITAEKTPMTDGEIKKVDKESGKVTIKHGEIKNLDMPPMTMVFRIKDPALLDTLKVGDKINFVADNINGKLTVTQIEMVVAK